MTSLTDQQAEAIERFRRLKVGAIFMEQGTGKTRVAVELANGNESVDRVLWLGPFSTQQTILEEVERWGLDRDFEFLGYETLSASDSAYLRTLAKVDPRTLVVADESIFIKNPEAKRSSRAVEIRRRAGFALALNGTPVVRDLWDLKRQIDWLSPLILSMDDRLFRSRYFKTISYQKANGDKGEFDRLYEPNVAHLLSLIEPYVFEAQLQIDVPESTRDIVHPAGPEASSRYQSVKRSTLDSWASMSDAIDAQALLTRLQVIAATDVEKCRSIADEVRGTHCLVFCQFVGEADLIGEHLDDFLRVDGSTPGSERDRIFAEHKAREVPLLMTFGTGSFGLNLQHVSTIHFASLTFDFGRMQQAAARVRRLGQDRPIEYVRHHSSLKISEFVRRNLENKDWLAEIVRGQIDLEEEL